MIDIDKSDIPGAGFVGSLIAVIGDIILFSGDVIIASLGALLGSVEIVGSLINLLGRFVDESGLMSSGAADQLILIGMILLLGGLAWRALRVIGADVKQRIKS